MGNEENGRILYLLFLPIEGSPDIVVISLL
jgi:hypothetical protein